MGAFESFLSKIANSIGGGEDPPKNKKTYTSYDEISRGNNFARDFLSRHGAPQYLVNNTVVARNVGDPIPQFEYPNGKPTMIDKPNLKTDLPTGVSINDVFQTKEGQYGFIHPQNGNWVQVDPQAIFQKYGQKK